MNLPEQYQWLEKEGAPKMIVEALKLFGTHEVVGKGDNPIILQWAKELGLNDYRKDDIAWCGLFMAYVAKQAGKDVPKNPLWALNWAKFGTPSDKPMLGDVLTFQREGGGHVALYVGEDKDCFHCLGGNQSDQVTISLIKKTRLFKARRPIYKTGQPTNVRQIFLNAKGEISTNEK